MHSSIPFLLVSLSLSSMTPCGFAAPPTGINGAGQLVLTEGLARNNPGGFAYARLQSGVQIRVNGTVKNVLFYGPEIVRVNSNLGKAYTIQPSLTVVTQPVTVPFEIKETNTALQLTSQFTARACG